MSRTRSASFIAPFVALAVLAAMTAEVPSALAQTPSFTLVGIPSVGAASRIQGLVSDGRTAVGTLGSASQGWFLWTPDGGRNDVGPLNQEALGISGDGQSVVGVITGLNEHAMKWTQSGGVQDLGTLAGFSQARAIDANQNGSIVVGTCLTVPNGTPQAFRWTQSGGMVGLGIGTRAYAVSGNGNVVVGESGTAPNGFVWTQGGGIQFLTGLSGGTGATLARGCNFDGSIVVGQSGVSISRPTMWINGTATELTNSVANYVFTPTSVSDDGSVVAGQLTGFGSLAGVWTQATGAVRLSDYLIANGATIPAGVELANCTAISSDGNTFAGYIVGSQTLPTQGFVATIAPPCPADLDNDGDFSNGGTRDHAVTIDDLLYFLVGFEAGSLAVDLDNGTGTGTRDNAVTIEDLLFFLGHFEAGC